MCGIGAIFNLNKQSTNLYNIDTMMAPIKKRGPDSYQTFKEKEIILGHRRLAIIDITEKSNQPFYWEDRFVIVFNGVIYNYIELRNELEGLGYKFNTDSDTEVLIASYAEWGEKCLNKFNGMWAFIIWDKEKKELFASRDRFGIKPLYWAEDNSYLFFASEIKQLRALGIGNKANMNEVSNFLYTGISGNSSNTFFKGINILKAGHNLVIKKNQKRKLIKWYFIENSKIEDTSTENLLSILNNSISLRMRGDVGIGNMLSGGLDSSYITKISHEIASVNKINYKIFHGASTDKDTNEEIFAQSLCRDIGKELNIKSPSYKEFCNNIKEICFIQDEPFGSTSIFMQYFVIEKAKKNNCKILLDGQGADELLFGYKRYLSLPLFRSIKKRHLKQFFVDLYFLLKRNNQLNLTEKIKYIFGPILYKIRINIRSKELSFINLPTQNSSNLYKAISDYIWDPYKLQKLEIFEHSLPNLLRIADRNSMSNSIELRLPFLDHRFVEASLKTNFNNKIYKGWEKFFIRNSKVLNKKISWRNTKLGFASPERSWIKKHSSKMLEEILISKFMAQICDKKKLKESWTNLKENDKWRIYNVAIWSDVMKVS